ncbi:MAG: hypothetical protein JSU63_16270 [Phycisphaerales bacterium]|nr:MAG: hypothetical protein JSU63_16270 [Phycisphaerales bacterium]
MSIEPFETAASHDVPTVTQLSVFVENRVGQLLRLTKLFDQTDIRILALSQVNSVDCAICRTLLDDPEKGAELLTASGFKLSETEVIVVVLPHGKRALLHTWMALLAAEVNIHYTYPLLFRPGGCAALAIASDSVEEAVETLRRQKFEVLSQADLMQGRFE